MNIPMNMSIRCPLADLPAIVAGLVREGVTFITKKCVDDSDDYIITLTGGY